MEGLDNNTQSELQTQPEVQPQAATTPAAPPQPAAMPAAAPKKHGKLLLEIVAIVLAVLILGGGGYAAYYYYFSVDYGDVLKQASANMEKLESHHYDMTFNASAEYEMPSMKMGMGDLEEKEAVSLSKGELKLTIAGDHVAKADDKYDMTSDVTVDIVSEALDANLGFSFAYVDEVIYAKVTKIPAIPFLPTEQFDFIADSWIRFDIPAIKAEFGLDAMIEGLKSSSEYGEYLENQEETQAKLQKVAMQFAFDDEVLEIVDVKKETIEAEQFYKYQMAFNKQNFKKYIRHIAEYLEEEIPTDEEYLEMDKFLASIKDLSFVMWVGQSDMLIHKVIGSAAISMDGEGRNPGGEGSISFDVNYSQFNAIGAIDAPAESEDFMQIMEQMMGPKTPTELPDVATAENLLVDADGDGIPLYDESYTYFTDDSVADYDGDGFNDGEEVGNGYDPAFANEKLIPYPLTIYLSPVKVSPEVEDPFGIGIVSDECSMLVPVERNLANSHNTIESAIDLMIQGPAADELAQYRKIYDEGVVRNDVQFLDNMLIVDFNKQPTTDMCMKMLIKEQFKQTFASFIFVDYIAITVNGEVQEIYPVFEQSGTGMTGLMF